MIRGELQDKYDFRRVEVVGPAVSGDLTVTSTIGIALAMIAIMIYIWFRFEWQFALGAIISMVHDVVFTIGLFVFLGIEFNLTSIAAILTIIGYSLNDTVVIYDRIRENLRRYKKMPLSMIIDVSLNQTLSRTILTGLTGCLRCCRSTSSVERSFAPSPSPCSSVSVSACSRRSTSRLLF